MGVPHLLGGLRLVHRIGSRFLFLDVLFDRRTVCRGSDFDFLSGGAYRGRRR
jgi:hypothetical protein